MDAGCVILFNKHTWHLKNTCWDLYCGNKDHTSHSTPAFGIICDGQGAVSFTTCMPIWQADIDTHSFGVVILVCISATLQYGLDNRDNCILCYYADCKEKGANSLTYIMTWVQVMQETIIKSITVTHSGMLFLIIWKAYKMDHPYSCITFPLLLVY